MGTLKINGTNILTYFTPVPSSEVGTKHAAFPDKIKGLTTEVDNNSKKVLIGWQLPDYNSYSSNPNYDAAKGKVKVNGKVAPIIMDGTRPRNISVKASITGCGLTYYLNNVNGSLYLSTSANSASGTFVVSSKAPNKDCIINLACWGAGGKGGEGAYWFLVGNWGGVGGGGGGKAFLTICVKNNDYLRIVTETDAALTGRTKTSNDTTFEAPGLQIYKSSGQEWCDCGGGYSGTSNHPRWSKDSYQGAGWTVVQTYGNIPLIKRKYASQLGTKSENGMSGKSVTFQNSESPYFGCPEGNQGSLVLTGNGGKGPDTSYTQVHGSGGAGSYGNGGNAGDTGNGSGGQAGTNGAGGGGGGSPAGGCTGGDGGLPGFIIFY